jgi:hypothetical protein
MRIKDDFEIKRSSSKIIQFGGISKGKEKY